MIQIDKSKTPIPTILTTGGKGNKATQVLIQAAQQGQIQFDFDAAIYAHPTVKTALIGLQNGKCCFCQGMVTDTSYGDIEHFRPKGGYQQTKDQPLQKPGYYWLAYDFSNLFFACQKCNEVYKRNYFPLADESKRASSSVQDYRKEDSLILHPEWDNPETHITFVGEMVKAKDDSVKGVETIKRTGLNRIELDESRLEQLKPLMILALIARSSDAFAPVARKHFKEIGQPGRIFSAMVRANFPDLV